VHTFRHRIGVAIAFRGVLRGSSLERAREPEGPDEWAPPGKIVELCAGPAGARTSAAAMVLRAAQEEGDPVAWVLPSDGPAGGPFPPDLAAAGIDLEALLVVRVPAVAAAELARAVELVLRTGAFGAVILDLSALAAGTMLRASWQGRLLGLAREHTCRVVVLAPSEASALGPLVSLRFDVRRAAVAPGRFRVEARVVKDKTGLHASRSLSFGGPG
jgi:recombination protein RecA